MNSDSQIHLGHRERMRRKLVSYGAEIFDTYELLEMLLYSVIPVRDTNPVAKRLLMAFGDLDGVLNASKEELISVDGIGSATANYLSTVGALPMLMPMIDIAANVLADYEEIGEYLVGYYQGREDYAVSILLFDNAMRPIRVVDVYDCDYGKGSVQCKPFLDLAMSLGATSVVVFHNHPFGPFYPSYADILTHKVIAEGFRRSGITLLDHYLVSGSGYIRIGEMANKVNGVDRLYSNFGIVCIKNDVSPRRIGENPLDVCYPYLESYLRYSISSGDKCKKVVDDLVTRYHRLDNILSRHHDELFEICGNAAVGLKLLAYVTSRRYTDKHRSGKKLDDWILDYFKWNFFGTSVENVVLALFDKNKKLLSVVKVSEGTISASDIVPRRAIEAAVKAKASFVVMAHNHPGGTCLASGNDIHATAIVAKALEGVGVKLLKHFVVAGTSVGEVEILDEIPMGI